MATEQSLLTVTGIANADLSAGQYCFVTTNSSARVALSAAAANADGILQDKPSAAGKSCIVAVAGISKVVASAAITKGDLVGCAASGQARTAAASDYIHGRALETASAQGQIISILLKPGGKL